MRDTMGAACLPMLMLSSQTEDLVKWLLERASVRVGGRRLFHSPGDRRRAAARVGRTGVGTSRDPRRAT